MEITELEANIDDMTPEQLGYVMELLLSAGALDVFFTNIIMKKNRPGVKLSVLCQTDKKAEMVDIMLRETSTFGVRYTEKKRDILERDFISVDTGAGEVRCKLGILKGEIIKLSPEYEDCKKIAHKLGKPLKEIYEEVLFIGKKQIGKIQ